MTALAAVPVDFRDCNALNANVRHGLADFVQLEGLDDGGDQLHAFIPAFTR
jgi:hypothetical protein